MDFEILYCNPCGYRERAEALAEELRERFGATATIREGKLGQFDVLQGDELVASKGKFLMRMLRHGPPSESEIMQAIERHLEVQTGDACEVPTAE